MAAFHIAAAAEPVELLAEWDSESLGSAPPDPDTANLAGCWQEEEENAEELRQCECERAFYYLREPLHITTRHTHRHKSRAAGGGGTVMAQPSRVFPKTK